MSTYALRLRADLDLFGRHEDVRVVLAKERGDASPRQSVHLRRSLSCARSPQKSNQKSTRQAPYFTFHAEHLERLWRGGRRGVERVRLEDGRVASNEVERVSRPFTGQKTRRQKKEDESHGTVFRKPRECTSGTFR